MALSAAAYAAATLNELSREKTPVRLLAATGNSQLEFLQALTADPTVDWRGVELFHLDEYAGLSQEHPASFARYIKTRLIEPTGIRNYHLLRGDGDPVRCATEMSAKISAAPVDLAFVGIGENGHLAFNDPPADFEAKQPYLLVQLDEKCRQQQVNEGWFDSLAQVPREAITISIPQLLSTREIICVVPDVRKAEAVAAALEGPITASVPASVLQSHGRTTVFLDSNSASLLRGRRT